MYSVMLNRLKGFFAKFQKSKKQSVDVRGEKKINLSVTWWIEFLLGVLCGLYALLLGGLIR